MTALATVAPGVWANTTATPWTPTTAASVWDKVVDWFTTKEEK